MSKNVIVVYDVKDDKIRYKLFKYLKDAGLDHIQFSVFGGTLADRYDERIVEDIRKIIDIEDKVHIIYLKSIDIDSVVAIGSAEIPTDRDIYIFD